MNKELALRTFGYLIGYYKTHDETIINTQEIEAIEFMLKNNEDLEQQCKKQKDVIDKAIELHNNFAKENAGLIFENDVFIKFMNNLLDILKEVSE